MIKFFLSTLLFGSMAVAGDAGCGLGSLVIKSNTKLLQLFAVTTNNSFGSQTLGITFGTSGCSAKGLVMNEKQIQYFVEVNQNDLLREMAQGYGDKLSTLAALNGCMDDSQITAFNLRAQASFPVIAPTAATNAVDIVNNMKSAALADVCTGS